MPDAEQVEDMDATTDEAGGGEPDAAGDEEDSAGGSSSGQDDERGWEPEAVPLVDELGVEDLTDILFGNRGRIFSAAGRESPVAEFATDGVLLRPPHKPFTEAANSAEVIVYDVDQQGILLNEFGEQRKIVGAKFRGRPIYTLGELKPNTVKHYAAWFDEDGKAHKFYVQGEALTTDMLYRIRNRTHNGEISVFPEIETD